MYDFKSARRRIEDLKLIYRQNKKHHEKMALGTGGLPPK